MRHEGRIRMILDGPEKGLWVAYCTGCDFETPPGSIEPRFVEPAEEHARAANLADEGATITTLSVEDRGRLYELAAEVARLVCVEDVTHVEGRARRRRLDLAANELGYLLGLPEPEFRELWREPSISDREALLQLAEEEPSMLHMPPTAEDRKRWQIWRVRREEALAVADAIRRGER